jgi:transglutaminase-like putative cysteine protease
MLYDIRQTTTYTYVVPVPTSRHTIRMQPLSRPAQRVIAASLTLKPAPVNRHDAVDFFGNAVTSALIMEPHTEFVITTRGRIEVDRPPSPPADSAPAWEAVKSAAVAVNDLGPRSPVHFVFPTPLVPVWEQIGNYCRTSFAKGRPILAAAQELTERIKADFKYDPAATDVTTPVHESFVARAGVCQDFAHIMISGLRTIGVPAAYVSGYLRTEPPPGAQRLVGADAMHAWVEVWCGERAGWHGFDPTNGVVVGNDHIILAAGRDYSDVSPTVGAFKSQGHHSMAVAVDVIPITA